MNSAIIRCALQRGVTSFIIHLAADQRRRFTLENENMAAEGTLTIAVSNERLTLTNPKWRTVDGAVPFRRKRLFDLSLMGIEAEFVKLTFQVDEPEKIAGRDQRGVETPRFTAQR